ncbi:TPA: peptidylprolyl isomerase [Pseudomonas aeruginosa]|nr:peptidylprolyl isomerase [Pseudomonas aeruginosa]
MHRLLSDRARGWRRALCGVALGLLAWSAHGVPAKAPQDLRIDSEVLPGKSVDLLEQALSRVKFNTDPQQLRRGLVENRLLARAVEDQLTAQSRADLDASVEIEAGNLLEQVYGRRYREDLGPYLRQPRALSAERLREVLAPRSRGLVENSLLLDETQRREAAGVELIGWQFPGQPAQVLDLLSLYEGDNVQGQVELQQGNLAYLARQVQTRIRRDYLWYRLARDGFGPAERQGVRTLVRDKLVRHRYLHQIGLYSDFHHESDALRELAGKVSDKDAEAYYRRNLERYRNVAQVQAAHIRLADQASADKVYAELRGGLAFDEAVRRYSLADDRDRDPPGDLGLIRPQDGRLDLLRKTALIQKADTVSQPMRIDGAFEIVRVRSRKDRQLPLDDRSVRFEVNQAVAREQLAAQFETRLRNLLAGARVEGL